LSAPPRILAIAGSDSSGGAGIQADIKTITMLGGYAMTAITAITAQNTLGVSAVEVLSDDLVMQQIAACVEDIGCDAIKIGMLGSEELVRAVSAILFLMPDIGARSEVGHRRKRPPPGVARLPIVVDPVMVATSGARLADPAAISAMTARLFPLATLLTPNLPELDLLAGTRCESVLEMKLAAAKLAATHATFVLAKGGHMEGDQVIDVLVSPAGEVREFVGEWIDTPHTHGTGCTLSSAIATFLGAGLPLEVAVERGRQFVRAALLAAPGFGGGHGPLGHAAVGRQASRS
jgi:hydroxymethylpyrimidine/phosphomethylpyrimidine kinase